VGRLKVYIQRMFGAYKDSKTCRDQCHCWLLKPTWSDSWNSSDTDDLDHGSYGFS